MAVVKRVVVGGRITKEPDFEAIFGDKEIQIMRLDKKRV